MNFFDLDYKTDLKYILKLINHSGRPICVVAPNLGYLVYVINPLRGIAVLTLVSIYTSV